MPRFLPPWVAKSVGTAVKIYALVTAFRDFFRYMKGSMEKHEAEIKSKPGVPRERVVDYVKDIRDAQLMAGNRISELLLKEAQRLAPDGSKNLDEYEGTGNWDYNRVGQRPSVDRFGVLPIAESLRVGLYQEPLTETTFGDDAVAVELSSVSEHTKFFTKGIGLMVPYRGGTKPHRIPAGKTSQYLTFHWKGRDRMWRSSGNQKPQQIDLGRLEYGDFLERAWKNVKPEAARIVREELV